jgi:hypothetical protein
MPRTFAFVNRSDTKHRRLKRGFCLVRKCFGKGDREMTIKLCECGCGLQAPVAVQNRSARGQVKGNPLRFVHGHGGNRGGNGGVHGMRYTPQYGSWTGAKQRCTNPKNKKWKEYGGRGIKFLFTSFEQFFAELGPRPDGMTLDRINNDGNYELGNVRWATLTEQNKNRRQWAKRAA